MCGAVNMFLFLGKIDVDLLVEGERERGWNVLKGPLPSFCTEEGQNST